MMVCAVAIPSVAAVNERLVNFMMKVCRLIQERRYRKDFEAERTDQSEEDNEEKEWIASRAVETMDENVAEGVLKRSLYIGRDLRFC